MHACGGTQKVLGVVRASTCTRSTGSGTAAYFAKVRESARKCAKVRESVGWATSAYSAKVCESEDCLAVLKLRKWRGPVHVLKLRK